MSLTFKHFYKMVVKREILYPFMLNCCTFTNDNFWKSIFEDLAYGIPPSGTFLSKNVLFCTLKDKTFSYKIENIDPSVLYTRIYEILTNKLGIYSSEEYKNKLQLFNNLENRLREDIDDWNKIRKKNIKELLIEKYIIDSMLKYNVPFEKSKKIMALIYLAFQFKVLTSKHINFSNGKISSIEGIEFKNGNLVLSQDLENFLLLPNVI